MALTFEQQFQVAMASVQRRDMDLLSKVLTDPNAVTINDQQSVAESLGVKRGLLAGFINIVADPTVWVAALMSRTFPTSAWLRGTLPQRYIGALNEFTGISGVTRPIEDFFRGTNVPRLAALKMRRETEVMQVASKMFEAMNRPNWKQEMPLVSMILEGQAPAGASADLYRVADVIRGGMDEMWGFLKKTKKIHGGLGKESVTRASSSDFLPHEAPKYLRDYLPHIPLHGDASIIELSGKEALKRMGRHGFNQAMELRGMRLTDIWDVTGNDKLSANFVKWQQFMLGAGHKINERLFRRVRHGLTLQSELGQDLFVSDLNAILPRYAHSVARTYANNAPISDYERRLVATSFVDDATGQVKTTMPTNEPIIVQVINEGLKASGGRMHRKPVRGTQRFVDVMEPGSPNMPTMAALDRLVRNLRGTASDDEILFGNLFSTIGRKVDQMKSNLTKKQVDDLDGAIRSFERNASYRRKVNGVAGWFYSSTLGLNPWSAMQNLLQPILTTAPSIGIGPTIAGYKVLADRIPVYARKFAEKHRKLRRGQSIGYTERVNVALEEAFRDTFPELARQGIKIDPRLFDIDETLLTQPGLAGGLARRFSSVDTLNKAIMQPFTHSEMSNQIISFYGGKRAIRNSMRTGEYAGFAGFDGMSPRQIDEMLNFEAGLIVNATQFRPGAGSRSLVQGMLPAPARMFTSFPTRLGSFFVNSTVRGAMTNKQIQQSSVLNVLSGGPEGELARRKVMSLGTGRNFGTIARSYLYGKIATEGASQTLDVDLSGSLGITSGFNVAPDGQPFAPLPLPPAAGVLYGVLSAAHSRDIKDLQPLHLPGIGPVMFPKTLMPGGVAVSRAVRAVQQFKPDMGGFVDDDERLMYAADTGDLLLATLGIPLDKNRRSREAMERTQGVRSSIRSIRRQYATAKINYDYDTQARLEAQWAKAFPGQPPLRLENRDLKRYRDQAKMPAVHRMIRTMGQSGQFMERHIMEFDPDLLSNPGF